MRLDREHALAAARTGWSDMPILWRCINGHTRVVNPSYDRPRPRQVPICDVCDLPVLVRRIRKGAQQGVEWSSYLRYHPACQAQRGKITRKPIRYVEVER